MFRFFFEKYIWWLIGFKILKVVYMVFRQCFKEYRGSISLTICWKGFGNYNISWSILYTASVAILQLIDNVSVLFRRFLIFTHLFNNKSFSDRKVYSKIFRDCSKEYFANISKMLKVCWKFCRKYFKEHIGKIAWNILCNVKKIFIVDEVSLTFHQLFWR